MQCTTWGRGENGTGHGRDKVVPPRYPPHYAKRGVKWSESDILLSYPETRPEPSDTERGDPYEIKKIKKIIN
ncbi:hypothetical protein ZOSMA_349G00050 [Zostera marina]|uniref:Uncharacterized protein n=1 Tax=Zostera marina TaxID=29655 RepID=A0A0K9P9C3_ZOSMR|nr:hypothetical protein ZOSMA_349G00050 [Zostera marina]